MCYFAAMSDEIGIRELRQEASVHLRAVADGAEFTITDRGRPVARLIPISPRSRATCRSRSPITGCGRPHAHDAPLRPCNDSAARA